MGYRSTPQTVQRFLCYRPLIVNATAIADGEPDFDADDKSIIRLHFRDFDGDAIQIQYNHTILIGTTPGARDVGLFRFRKNFDVDAGIGFVDVNETAFGDVPVADGMYITFLKDRRIWEKKIRRKLTGSIDFTEYTDYDIAYGGENYTFYPPIINITRDIAGHAYLPMGMVDSGEDYRIVDLTAFFSISLVNAITAYSWFIDDCTYEMGYDGTMITIKIRAPIGYRELRVSVLTATGISTRYLDLWTFSGPDDPNLITRFVVERDTRSEGRDMSFNIWDDEAGDLPEGTKVGYFEVAEFGDGEIPDDYIGQFLGWTTHDSIGSRIYRTQFKIDVGGYQTWLDKINIGAQTIYDPRTQEDPDGVETRFIEMRFNEPDKMVHYYLRTNSTALEMMNLFLSGYSVPIEGYTSAEGSLWSVIVSVVGRYFGVAAMNSTDSLYLRTHYDYLEQVDRDAIDPAATIDKVDWTDQQAPEFTDDKIDKIGLVDFYGSNYDILFDSGGDIVDFSHVYRVNAPGYIPGKGPGTETGVPDIFLMTTNGAVLQIRRLGGHHYARLNNKMTDISILLRWNMDNVEIAHGKPIIINYIEENAREFFLVSAPFLVKNISVQHSNNYSEQSKIITWIADRVTKGYPGLAVDVTQKIDIEPYPFPILSAGTRAVGMITEERDLFLVYDIDTDTPTTIPIDISGLIPEDIVHFVSSPFSPYYRGSGNTIDIYLITTGGDIYRIQDITGARTATLLFSAPGGSIGHFIQYERGLENYIVATYKTAGFYPHVVVSLDGVSFTDYAHTEAAFGPGGKNIAVSPHTGNILFGIQNPSPFRGELWVSEDQGTAFAYHPVPTLTPTFSSFHIPFQSSDDMLLYSVGLGLVIRSNSGLDSTITPSGHTPSPTWSALKSCDVDKNILFLICVGMNFFYSIDEGATWTLVGFDSGSGVVNGNIAGDDPETLFAWGVNYFGWKQAIDPVIKTKGSISGNVVNIFGIPNTP